MSFILATGSKKQFLEVKTFILAVAQKSLCLELVKKYLTLLKIELNIKCKNQTERDSTPNNVELVLQKSWSMINSYNFIIVLILKMVSH